MRYSKHRNHAQSRLLPSWGARHPMRLSVLYFHTPGRTVGLLTPASPQTPQQCAVLPCYHGYDVTEATGVLQPHQNLMGPARPWRAPCLHPEFLGKRGNPDVLATGLAGAWRGSVRRSNVSRPWSEPFCSSNVFSGFAASCHEPAGGKATSHPSEGSLTPHLSGSTQGKGCSDQ